MDRTLNLFVHVIVKTGSGMIRMQIRRACCWKLILNANSVLAARSEPPRSEPPRRVTSRHT